MNANGNLIEMTGQRFGALTVLSRAGSLRSFAAWLCRCDCGQEVVVRSDKLREGRRKACTLNGHTWQSQQPRALSTRYPSEYSTWEHMHARCKNKGHRNYKNYGGRGIRVCKEWRSFEQFFKDLGAKPSALHTIERDDTNGNYEPANCRWATAAEQRRNTRTSVFVEYEGQRMLLTDVVEKLGLKRSVVYGRLKNGWHLEDALTVPVLKYKQTK